MAIYTQDVRAYMEAMLGADLELVWEKLNSKTTRNNSEFWSKTVQNIADEMYFSSRFALVRILQGRAGGPELCSPLELQEEADADFTYQTKDGQEWSFDHITFDHIRSCGLQESIRYISLLNYLAAEQDDYDPDIDADIIHRAWYTLEEANEAGAEKLPENKPGMKREYNQARKAMEARNKALFSTRITRQEALRLGHMLQLTRQEMEQYLLRVFDVEGAGFCYTSSDDLIDMFGFDTKLTYHQTEKLKQIYHSSAAAAVPKVAEEDRLTEWTHDASLMLPQLVDNYVKYPDEGERSFMEWLQEQAPYLDCPSFTAVRLLRRLAGYLYLQDSGELNRANISAYIDDKGTYNGLFQLLNMEDDDPLIKKCYLKCAEDPALVVNAIMSISGEMQSRKMKDMHDIYRVPVINQHNVATVEGQINTDRNRLKKLLMDQAPVEKSDLLYLLWTVFAWDLYYCDQRDQTDVNDLWNDFIDIAESYLQKAMLPAFYPPHPLEQSMLLSIICAQDGHFTPAEVYGQICDALYSHRKSRHKEQTEV